MPVKTKPPRAPKLKMPAYRRIQDRIRLEIESGKLTLMQKPMYFANFVQELANMFELVPIINSIKGGQIMAEALSADTFNMLQETFRDFLVDILGMQPLQAKQDNKMDDVMNVLIDLRKDAKKRKDFATSDAIRNKLAEAGILLKDEKDGGMSYSFE